MPKRLCKRIRLAQERFRRAVTELLVSKGATPGSFYDFQIETKAGILHVTLHEDWIATRFDDVERARQVLGTAPHGRLNPHSGKWNFHFEDAHLADDTALAYFSAHLRPLLLGDDASSSNDMAIDIASARASRQE